jgi:hypothetical protein
MSDQWSTSGREESQSDPMITGADFSDRPTGAASAGQSRQSPSQDMGTMDKAREAMGTVQQKADELGDQAATKADAGKEKAASGLDSIASTLREKGQSMGEGQIGSMATMAADKIETGAEMLRSKDTDQMVDDLEALIRRRPVESLLVAVGAGYLLSRAL